MRLPIVQQSSSSNLIMSSSPEESSLVEFEQEKGDENSFEDDNY
jgi:hypothetical protein